MEVMEMEIKRNKKNLYLGFLNAIITARKPEKKNSLKIKKKRLNVAYKY